MVDKHSWVVPKLGCLFTIQSHLLIEPHSLTLRSTGEQERVNSLGKVSCTHVQAAKDSVCAVLCVLRGQITFQTGTMKLENIREIYFWVIVKEQHLTNVFPHQHVARLTVFIVKGLRASGEQKSPPQAQEDTNSPQVLL